MQIFKSIRFKLMFLALFAVLSIMALLVLSDVRDTEERIIESQKGKVILLSDTINHSLMIFMLENRWNEIRDMIDNYIQRNSDIKEVSIFNPDNGKVFISANRGEIGKEISREIWDRSVSPGQNNNPALIKRGEELFATRLISIKNLPPCYACHSRAKTELGIMYIEISLLKAQQSMRDSRYKHILGLAISCILISLIFWLSINRLLIKPLNEMVNIMKKVEQKDLSVRIDSDRNDEFGFLSRSFNNMIISLEESKKELETFHLQQIEKASKLASLGEIISSIAHEIKNPLTGINCAVQLVYNNLREDNTQKPVVAEVLNQIGRLDRFVKDLLSYAKPTPLQFVPFQIKESLKIVLFFVHSEAKKKHIEINTFSEDNIPGILMDPNQMQQVFLNIIINAMDSMPQGGTLTISVAVKDYREVSGKIKEPAIADKWLAVSFEDNGTGISQDDIEHIFEPFYSKKTKGTGLGLSISQKIVHNHRGEIFVDSTPGKGTLFTVYLPVITLADKNRFFAGELKGDSIET